MKEEDKMAEILGALKQELIDFKSETFKRLDRIEKQTMKTNGRVNLHDTDISLLQRENDTCPARIYFKTESRNTKYERSGMIIMIIINVVLLGVNFYTKHGGN